MVRLPIYKSVVYGVWPICVAGGRREPLTSCALLSNTLPPSPFLFLLPFLPTHRHTATHRAPRGANYFRQRKKKKTDVMAEAVEVRDAGEGYGAAMYAVRPIDAGDVLLEETPVVFVQSFASRRGPAGLRCCRGCGVVLGTLLEECERLGSLAQSKIQENCDVKDGKDDDCTGVVNDGECAEIISSPQALYETLKEFRTSSFFSAGLAADDSESLPQVSDPRGVVEFCCAKCKVGYIHDRGGRFLLFLTSTFEESTPTLASKRAPVDLTSQDIQTPSAEMIIHKSFSLDAAAMAESWSSKAQILATLEFLAENYNERLSLILSILALCLHHCFAFASECVKTFQTRYATTVQTFLSRYAEDSSRLLTSQQRAFLRFSWKCVCRWLDLCFMEERGGEGSADPFAWLPLQLYLRCFWVADTNVHMFVALSPLHSLLRHRLSNQYAVRRQDDKSSEGAMERLDKQSSVLRGLFCVVDPTAAHATGVALYDVATKVNHSCVPSARCVPTHGVRAVVVALRDIKKGEEIRISYIDLNAHIVKEKRREYLRARYGFECDCSLCSR